MEKKAYINFLVTDIGCTNGRFALKKAHVNEKSEVLKVDTVREAKKESQKFPSFEEMTLDFLKGVSKDDYPEVLVCAIAGASDGKEVKVGNAPHWPIIIIANMQKTLSIPRVEFINDLCAAAYGILGSSPAGLYQLYMGPEEARPKIDPQATKAVMGVGTGLGESILVKETTGAKKYFAVHTEGGYADFPPHNELEFELLQYLQKKYKTICTPVERALSGPGLANIYDFLCERSKGSLKEIIKRSPEEIVQNGLKKKDSLEGKALDLFAGIYGAEAGNLGAKTLCYGGLYFVGSLTNSIKEFLSKSDTFYEYFYNKENLTPYLKKVPIFVGGDNVGMQGVEKYALEVLLGLTQNTS